MRMGTLEQVYQDMKHGVYNFTKDGKCSKCGNCCTALLPMTKEELKALQRYVKRHHIQIVRHEGGFDLTCPFRNDELGICMCYEVRPQICRDFRCDKPQKKIDKPQKKIDKPQKKIDKPQKKIDDTKEKYQYDNRFYTTNLRTIFN